MKRGMRVAFDARGHSITGGGTFVYMQALANAVGRHGVTMSPVFTGHQRALKRRMGIRDWTGWIRRSYSRGSDYSREVHGTGADLFCTVHHNYFPYVGVPRVLHLQDLAYLHTDYYDRPKRLYWRRQLVRALRDYEGLLAISAFTRADVAELFGVDPDRITVIPHGLRSAFIDRPVAHWTPGETLQLLCVGVHHPRKRLPLAVELMAALQDLGVPARLRIVGPFSSDTERLRRTITARKLDGQVDLTGPVDFDELLRSYQEADALLWTSAFEGFGFPLAEAMALSLPVISVTNTTVPEVTGGHYLEIDLSDLPTSAGRIRDFVEDPVRVQQQVSAAHSHAQKYTWETAAGRTVDFWRKVCNGN